MKAAVITVSDRCHAGLRPDRSGPALVRLLQANQWDVPYQEIVPDEPPAIRSSAQKYLEKGANLVICTGGTGVSPRDVTPESLRPLVDKEIPGLGELMRSDGLKKTRRAALSRSFAGIAGRALLVALPGSEKGATESLEAILDLIPHCIDLAEGKDQLHG